MKLLFLLSTCLFAFASLAATQQPVSVASKLVELLKGTWEGDDSMEVDKKKTSGKARMKCEPIGKDFGIHCLFTSTSAPDNPEHWYIGHNQKNESNHVFIITAKSAHDHAAKWISDNEIFMTPVANNPDGCSVIDIRIKRIAPGHVTFEGSEKDKEGKLVKFFNDMKRK